MIFRSRPSREEISNSIQESKPHEFKFEDDGLIPNHPAWPLIIYKSSLRFVSGSDPAAMFEDLFASNNWRGSWRNGIYRYVHYHSRIHEVLGVACGQATVEFGGDPGSTIEVHAGDVAILPAGTGHKCLRSSDDFLVVGAYPPDGTYDLCTTSAQHDRALTTIPNVPRPRHDPVYGEAGPLIEIWR